MRACIAPQVYPPSPIQLSLCLFVAFQYPKSNRVQTQNATLIHKRYNFWSSCLSTLMLFIHCLEHKVTILMVNVLAWVLNTLRLIQIFMHINVEVIKFKFLMSFWPFKCNILFDIQLLFKHSSMLERNHLASLFIGIEFQYIMASLPSFYSLLSSIT